ncbi:uncharacterized protein MELLADRAFT_87318 [Melampsora larici-populina 98AG31]|uniref:tRNA 4-demethylwyosine synthase (AdoMet-dependent) n=1 Tax=Melampsora larici-populina (strain 98AG31 / pathotype 3-4-7) TaxID=747676 RepID=F4RMT9_MELLP|nr:uncharacterized protein MELLADRAFT_87318 [Melampsora larici-populina 98AG31]EGG06322.1 hypothetical protein MELLADRAFT_87318 [Melampsora larici-populina 98AG31]
MSKQEQEQEEEVKVLILYSSLSNTTKSLSFQLQNSINLTSSTTSKPRIHSLHDFDLDQIILTTSNTIILFALPSYNVESPVDSILAQFKDSLYDFRFSKDSLNQIAYGVIGIGHIDYGQEFCKQAIELDFILDSLGAKRVIELVKIDVSVDPELQLGQLVDQINQNFSNKSFKSVSELEIIPIEALSLKNSELNLIDDEEYDSDDDYVEYDQDRISKPLSKLELAKRKSKAKQKNHSSAQKDDGADIEDLGVGIPQSSTDELSILPNHQVVTQDLRKEMISPMTRKSLTKQGYAIVGSHSAVKTCRWTKASLRGRGFCYKHTFYGIQSHRCMEATPSLACANKCTFCWRAHTNPVGTSWRWKTDDAEFVIEESLKEHDRLIKQLLGMPGVRPDRFLEARTPKHAALSLVGEPVMYPHIKKYIELLTEKRISTFLVTNAQFPDSLKDLPPVTQLYLSIDAGNKSSLKSIDRPLHRDFWERFLESIEIVKGMKKTRTIFRLTLVKGENSEEILDYVELIKRGRPDFIEVKGVTYCGYAPSSNLTIKNSPFHEEVVNFVQALCYELNSTTDDPNLQYDLASEHAHSCCVLAAHQKYRIDDQWHTWIDYERFFDLVEEGKEFDGTDYMALTPDFAVFGAPEAGFSPEDVRWFRKGKGPKESEAEAQEAEEEETIGGK